jgi:mannose-6-phosphate isomerase-like protein (cupin superfamily)
LEELNKEYHRPWGYYIILADEKDHKVKRIVVKPGKRLSLQRHQKRSEHWYVLFGTALVTLDDKEIEFLPGQAADIPKHTWHRVKNPGEGEMAFIEVQTGEYFGEDDIERKEDDFGRT